MRFVKMHGLGNDYVFLVEEHVPDPAALVSKINDSHVGIGGDGLVLVERGTDTDFAMRIFNRDGSEAEMCGNAARCVGKLVYEAGLTTATSLTLQTGGGIRNLTLHLTGERVNCVSVNMGTPALLPPCIPSPADSLVVKPLSVMVDGESFEMICLALGNPHGVIFVENTDLVDVSRIGPQLERHPLFPQRINVEFIQVVDPTHLRMRVWERGSGETRACGTGACSALVAGSMLGRCERRGHVVLPGGTLDIEWDPITGDVVQSGPAAYVASGDYLAED